jgi:hypothetical protein
MENLEIRKGIFQADVRRNIRNHIQIQYEIGFESFLQENYLADEVFYINYIDKNQKEVIAEYEKIVNFHDISEGEAIIDDIANQWYEEKILRDHYWYFKEFQSFLNERLEEITKDNQPQQPEPEPLDLSKTSAVEKIIYLNELGIIDFLKLKPEFTLSTNLMATILSAITDVKATTLQTSLNRLISNDITDKNHPYRTQKTVDKVRQTLVNKNIKPKAS